MASSATMYSLKDQSISNIVEHKDQYFDYLLVLDFEATCQKGQQLKPHEIIEFPCALLNTRKGFEVESIFHKYVRPVHHPILTEFCTELTGITQDIVNEADDFESVFRQFRLWVEDELALINPETNKSSTNDVNKFTFVICGDWDFKYMLPEQCSTSNISIPGYMKKWINVKKSFAASFGIPDRPKGLSSMLRSLEMEFVGRPHSGIDDVKNIVRIVKSLVEKKGIIFENTSYL